MSAFSAWNFSSVKSPLLGRSAVDGPDLEKGEAKCDTSKQKAAERSSSYLEDTSSSYFSFGWIPGNLSNINSNDNNEYCGLSFMQRVGCFSFFIIMAIIAVTLSFFNLPLAILRPQRFILPFSLGSLLFLSRYVAFRTHGSIFFTYFISSTGFLVGWVSYWRQLTKPERLPISIGCALIMLATLYVCLIVKNYILVLVLSILQMLSIFAFTLSSFPGGPKAVLYAIRYMVPSF